MERQSSYRYSKQELQANKDLSTSQIARNEKKYQELLKEYEPQEMGSDMLESNIYGEKLIDELLEKKLKSLKVKEALSIQHLIQAAYDNKPSNIQQMKLDYTNITKYVSHYRPVLGDGCCFYRSIYYALLEKHILNGDFNIFKEIVLDLHEFVYVNNLNRHLINKYTLERLGHFENVFLWFYLVINKAEEGNSADKVKELHSFFTKQVVQDGPFDIALSLWVRLKCFEFIKQNQNKSLNAENDIPLYCIIPEKFTNEHDGLDKYFSENLLKIGSDSDEIVNIVAPFIFGINLKIIHYNINQTNLKETTFKNGLNEVETITLILHKVHYNIGYSKQEFAKIEQYSYFYSIDCTGPLSNFVNANKYETPKEESLNCCDEPRMCVTPCGCEYCMNEICISRVSLAFAQNGYDLNRLQVLKMW